MVFDLLLMLFGELSAVEQPLRRGPVLFLVSAHLSRPFPATACLFHRDAIEVLPQAPEREQFVEF